MSTTKVFYKQVQLQTISPTTGKHLIKVKGYFSLDSLVVQDAL